MSTDPAEDLRKTFHRVVPAAPDSSADASALVVAGRAARRRRRAVGSGALVVVAVATALIVPSRWGDSDGNGHQVGDRVFEEREQTLGPYDAPACPTSLPDLDAVNLQLPDLGRVSAVRLCSDRRDAARLLDHPTAAELASGVPVDALVRGLGGFASRVTQLPEVDAEPCANLDVVLSRSSLAFYLIDGSRATVPIASCDNLLLDGRPISQVEVSLAFMDALNRQRTELAYGRDSDDELTCRSSSTTAPVEPTRERLVAAVICQPRGDGPAVPLYAEALALLNDRWAQTAPPATRAPTGQENDCLDLEEAPAYVMARTDRADVIRLFSSPCGYLAHSPWHGDGSQAVPVTLDELE